MTLLPVKALDLSEGDLVDLECVPAPYVSDVDRENIYAYEYAIVDSVVKIGLDGVLVHFDKTSIEFPLDYELMTVAES